MTRRLRFLISFCVSAGIFNLANIPFMVGTPICTCFSCFHEYVLPFWVVTKEVYLLTTRFSIIGLLLDLIVWAACAAVISWIWARLSARRLNLAAS